MEKSFIDYKKLAELVRAARMMAASRWLEKNARGASSSPEAETDSFPDSAMVSQSGLAKRMTDLGRKTTAKAVTHWEDVTDPAHMSLDAFIAMVTATRPPRGFRFFDQVFDPSIWPMIEAAFRGE